MICFLILFLCDGGDPNAIGSDTRYNTRICKSINKCKWQKCQEPATWRCSKCSILNLKGPNRLGINRVMPYNPAAQDTFMLCFPVPLSCQITQGCTSLLSMDYSSLQNKPHSQLYPHVFLKVFWGSCSSTRYQIFDWQCTSAVIQLSLLVWPPKW